MKPNFENTGCQPQPRNLRVSLAHAQCNTQDAEDCLQDTFLRAYKAYKRLDEKGQHARLALQNSHQRSSHTSQETRPQYLAHL